MLNVILLKSNFLIMKRLIIITCSFIFLMTGCREKENTNNASSPVEEETTKNTQKEQEIWKSDIRLDQGNQWHANRETTEGILNMTRLLAQASPSLLEDYRELGNELNEEKNLIIKRCTMKGASHDNLHIYLQPLIGKIGELQEVESVEQGELLIADIEEHLQAYHSYFI